MIDWLLEADTSTFLFLNGLHADWIDPVMNLITYKYTWFPFYAVIIGLLIYDLRKKAIVAIPAIVAVITASDQLASGGLKPGVMRLRPCHLPDIQELVHVVEGCGGQYGFVSSHAANSFGLAAFLVLMYDQKYPAVRWMYVWAFVVSYSRIYVGVHYPLDLIVGAAIGIAFAYVLFQIYDRYTNSAKWLS